MDNNANTGINSDLVKYYKDRAAEYERIYLKPERQSNIAEAQKILETIFKQKSVLEIACGTGFWTESISRTAASLLATDINKEVLDIAIQKTYQGVRPVFEVADIYTFHPAKKSETLFGGFIWSHIKKEDLEFFLSTVKAFVAESGKLVFMDNNYVEGSNHPITETDENGNTYQSRKLSDGSSHRVLKNFPDEQFLCGQVKNIARDARYTKLKYFWILEVILK